MHDLGSQNDDDDDDDDDDDKVNEADEEDDISVECDRETRDPASRVNHQFVWEDNLNLEPDLAKCRQTRCKHRAPDEMKLSHALLYCMSITTGTRDTLLTQRLYCQLLERHCRSPLHTNTVQGRDMQLKVVALRVSQVGILRHPEGLVNASTDSNQHDEQYVPTCRRNHCWSMLRLRALRFWRLPPSRHHLPTTNGVNDIGSAIFYLSDYLRFTTIKKKPSSELQLFPYDGNVVGGTLIGVGMALSGACPGTVVVQIATGISSGLWVALGGVLGAGVYIALKPSLSFPRVSVTRDTRNARHTKAGITPSTIADALHTNEGMVLYGWETMCAAGLYITKHIQSNPIKATVLVDSLWGGPLIGLAQAASVIMNGHSIGVSGVYEGLAYMAMKLFRYPFSSTKRRWPQLQITPSMSFAAGIYTAAYLLASSNPVMPTTAQAFAADDAVRPLTAVIAGAMMVFGARLGGGCTSGHAISGLATFSISSLVTTAAMFAAGVAVTFAMG
nr:hypothetical protein CFP56_09449 [Quercus suber]